MFYIIQKISLSILYVVINHLTKPVFNEKYYRYQESKKYLNTLSLNYIFNDFVKENYHFELKNINEEILFIKELTQKNDINIRHRNLLRFNGFR